MTTATNLLEGQSLSMVFGGLSHQFGTDNIEKFQTNPGSVLLF